MHSLIVRLPNHLGDACMALPAIDALAAAGGALALAGRPWAVELFAATAWPVIVLPAGHEAGTAALRAALRPLSDGVESLLLTNSFSSALAFRMAGARPSGYATDGRRLLLREAIPVPRQWAADMHTVDYYLHLAQCFARSRGAPAPGLRTAGMPVPHLPVGDAARARSSTALQSAGVQGPYVVLCPTARGQHRGRDKCWDGFGRLADDLQARGCTAVVCPGPGETDAARAAVPRARLIEPLDLGAFAALLAGSQLVVANDSGPGHLAAAVGATLVSVFGVTDPTKTRPVGRAVYIIGGADGWPAFAQVADQVMALLPG